MNTHEEINGKRNKRFVLAQLTGFLLLPFAAMAAAPTLTTYYWASNETSLVSGAFNDKANWLDSSCRPAASVPGALSFASFYHVPAAEYTVKLPEGVYSNYASLRIYGRKGRAVTLDGRGSVFASPTTATDNYAAARVQFYTSNQNTGYESADRIFAIDCGGAADYTSGYCLSNVVWRFKSRWSENAPIESIEFKQGLFNFYDYDGMPHPFRFYLYSGNPKDGTLPISVVFGAGSSLRIYDFYPVWQYFTTGVTFINFNGGRHHIFGTFNLFQNKVSSATAVKPCLTEVHIRDDAFVNANAFKVYHSTSAQAYGANQHTLVAVENGGTLVATGGVQWATFNAQYLYVTNGAYCAFGPIDGSVARPVNNFANAAIQNGIGTNIVAVLVDQACFDMTGDNRIGNVDIALRDSALNLTGTAHIGYDALRSARVTAANSTIAVSIDGSSKAMYVGNSGTGMVELVDSKITFPATTAMRLGENVNSCGEFVLDGGSFAANSGIQNGNLVIVGNKGSGRLTVKNGHFEAYRILVRGDDSGTSCPTCIVHQTGGTIKSTVGSFSSSENSFYANRIGVNSKAGVSKLILDGGEFHSARLLASNSALNSPSTGCHAYFLADGGTIVGLTPSDSAEGVITLKNFEKASLGPKGLTIRTPGETRTEQDFCDKEGCEGSGRLLLDGPGVKKLYGTNSTESLLVCVGGITQFLPLPATGENACHLSHLIVTNDATFSIAGSQDGAHFKAVTLADVASGATFAMDSADRVTVDGAMVIGGRLTLSLADAAAVGTHPLFTAAGDASAATKANWSAARIVGADHLGLVYTLSADYDGTTDKTFFNLIVTAGGPLTGETVWQNDSNWDGAMLVKFTDASPAAVAVNSAAAAGAVRFDANKDFTLSGTGPLSFSDRGGYAAIETVRGVQTVETPIEVPRDMRITVAAGATNVVSGAITGGGIVKDGRGTAKLTNGANSLPNGVAVKDGLFSVSGVNSLGGAPVVLSGGTLEIASTGRMQQEVEIATPHSATAAVVKVDADVTMPAPKATLGAFIKRGAGRLTFETSGEVPLCSFKSGTLGTASGIQDVNSITTFDGEGNYSVGGATAFGGLNVAEGELCLRGLSDGALFTVPAYLCIGIGTDQGTASPGLVIDHASLNCTAQYIDLGDVRQSAFATNVYLIATNGATVVGNFKSSEHAAGTNRRTYALFDASVQQSTYRFYPNRNSGEAEYVYRNGSLLSARNTATGDYLTAPGVEFTKGAAIMTFDASTLGRKLNLSDSIMRPTTVLNSVNNASDHVLVFTNDAAFYCSWVSNAYNSANLTIRFAGGEWFPLVEGTTGDFAFDFGKRDGIEIDVVGDGLSLSPAAGSIWTFRNAITGSGKVVKKGAGTLAFETPDAGATVPWSFAGALDVQSGAVTVASGSMRSNARVSLAAGTRLDLLGGTAERLSATGGGIVANGTLSSPTLLMDVPENPLDTPCLTFASDIVVTERLTLDFGRTAENPLAVGTVVPMAVWSSGSDPSALKLRVVNTGSQANSGVLFVEGGILYCRLSCKGFYLLFN